MGKKLEIPNKKRLFNCEIRGSMKVMAESEEEARQKASESHYTAWQWDTVEAEEDD